VQPKFGLLVCDEAHRLKNQAAKTSQMLGALPIEQRILLTGTPIQNNLLEFHAVVDLVSPGLMGNKKTFKSIFEEPIMRSRVAGCSKKVLEKGELMSEALQVVTQGLLLRRTADILSDYLPPKHEMVVFCSPTPLQIQLYELMINSDRVHDIVSGNALHSFALTAIGILCKLCNSPELLVKGLASNGISEGGTTKALLTGLRDHLPTKVMNIAEMSGKLLCVMKMLIRIKEQTNDKVVLISNFTSTLDILESLCRKKKFTFARLDGKTKQEDRINYINSFNQSDQNSQFIFLLSKKAGGTGVNLIGANRLILFDSDWNPSNDRQAMARIHRDGQKKQCYIYRMLIPGTMDEKIYQRQISKLSLSDSLIVSEFYRTCLARFTNTFIIPCRIQRASLERVQMPSHLKR
jgi:DNA repair and recombination protein RAD54B